VEAASFKYERRIPIDGGELVIAYASTPAFMNAYGRDGYRWLSLGGLLVTAALVTYIRMHLTRTAEVERQVSERTQALRRVNDKLTGEVCEREQAEGQLRTAQKKLVEAAHRAGMADVATDVLHNVGNVLNSINVSTSRMIDIVIHSKVASLARVTALVSDHRDELGTFLTEDDRGQQVPVFLEEVSRRLSEEQSQFAEMLDGLAKNVKHIKDTITMQQSYAKVSGMEEQVSMADVIEDAIQINSAGLDRHGVHLVREYETLPPVQVNKQKTLQILVNLLSNGKYASGRSQQDDKVITIRLEAQGSDAICVEVIDNGVGIAPENLNRIFQHGFTTKKEGHGFGLHGAALAAKEMGGTLNVHSDGLGQGAVFTLILPMKKAKVTTCQTTALKPDACS
jgi:two-component system, NtrC family, sensor kinase